MITHHMVALNTRVSVFINEYETRIIALMQFVYEYEKENELEYGWRYYDYCFWFVYVCVHIFKEEILFCVIFVVFVYFQTKFFLCSYFSVVLCKNSRAR